jgi:hypothetical protein
VTPALRAVLQILIRVGAACSAGGVFVESRAAALCRISLRVWLVDPRMKHASLGAPGESVLRVWYFLWHLGCTIQREPHPNADRETGASPCVDGFGRNSGCGSARCLTYNALLGSRNCNREYKYIRIYHQALDGLDLSLSFSV